MTSFHHTIPFQNASPGSESIYVLYVDGIRLLRPIPL